MTKLFFFFFLLERKIVLFVLYLFTSFPFYLFSFLPFCLISLLLFYFEVAQSVAYAFVAK